MSFEPEYPDTLELIGPYGGRVKVADFLMGEPIEVDGLKYKTITITTPSVRRRCINMREL